MAESDTDADVDAGLDTDVETDSDADASPDTDTDPDADTDTSTDADTPTDADTSTDAGTGTEDASAGFRAGVRDVVPVVVGMVPIALVAGIGAVSAGLPATAAIAMSLFWYAGAAQLAAIGVLDAGAPLAAVVATALVVNLRYVMYSASIATFLDGVRERWKWAMSYFLADQNYALSVVRYENDATVHRVGYYFGTALGMWVVWQTGTVVGVLVGARVPASWRLDLALPLTFMALLAPALEDRPSWAAAGVAGAVAVAGAGLPANAGLMLAAVLGIGTGYVLAGEDAGGVEP